MKLIDKDALIAEIERRLEALANTSAEGNREFAAIIGAQHYELINFAQYINTLEVKEVDLEKEIQRQYNVHKNPDNSIIKDCVIMTKDGFEYFAKHFFELGVKANQENNIIGTLEREVKIDAGGYPYIICDIEFYDYDKDIPLAKEGDKVKVILVKGE